MDALRFLGAVTREVRTVERNGRAARAVVAACSYDTSIDDLWDCITNPERIPRWFLPVSGDLRLGGRYQLQGNAGGEITACDPPRLLTLTWEFGGQESLVQVELAELSDGGTQLRLEHTVPVDDHWNQYGPGAVGVGWDLTLAGLLRHLAAGAMPKVPPDMKALIRCSSEGWYRASIAAGGDAEQARAAAERTSKFYGGI
jgi:uncharacterized protein YndB with AHSA1/START domain